jgi:hypothetical protein
MEPQTNQNNSTQVSSAPDYLEEHIIQHPKKESFFDNPVFLVLYFVALLIIGGALGAYLAIR